jgi:hypothetical protein
VTAPQQPQTGQSFSLTGTDLDNARREFDQAAVEVQKQFSELVARVVENPSEGAAFRAAIRVANQLEEEANKFRKLTRSLAEDIATSRTTYAQLNAAGADDIAQVGRGLDGGATYSRLVPKGPN